MQHSRKLESHNQIFLRCLALYVILLTALIAEFGYFLSAKAATISTDPSVLIVVDTTNAGCVITIQSKKLPCPPGTVWDTKIVTLSLAHKQQLPFLMLPSAYLSRSEYQQLWPQINQLKQRTAQLMQISSSNAAVLPLSVPCGSDSGHVGVTWSLYNNFSNRVAQLYSTIDYYVYPNPNCTQVLLQQSSVHVNSESSGIWWERDQYASWSQGWLCNLTSCYVYQGKTYYENPDVQQTKGYTYETVIEGQDGWGYYSGWCDINHWC